ncbi:MAG: hypothetical protein KGP28_11770, partial [Bdellovibrionales bacterium]|nr:hypothetical protein [Bdellovibrionales bacterium]
LRIPTFDLDESLYRRISQAMKLKGDPWWLSWDSSPLYHKPPILYWLIVAISNLVDTGREVVSSLASRIPSILSSVFIFLSLRAGVPFILPGPLPRSASLTPIFALLCATFPLLTSAAVIFDPLQTLTLMPALLIPTRIFLRDEVPPLRIWIFFGASLAAATMVKGLNGILIPSFAFGLHLLFAARKLGLGKSIHLGLRFWIFSFLPATILSAAFFLLLDRKIGRAFTEEFFWVQHFGRSQTPMEAHSGSLLYHPLILFFGGGFLTPVLISVWKDRRPNLVRFGFPLTFALAFVLAFSLSATKLPHYTWPAWPALALFVGIVSLLPSSSNSGQKPNVSKSKLLTLAILSPVILLGVLLLTFATASESMVQWIAQAPHTKSIPTSFIPLDGFQKMTLWLGSISCFVFLIRNRFLCMSPSSSAFLSTVSLCGIVMGLGPNLDSILVEPFEAIARDLKNRNPAHSECIRYSGPLSATFSIALGPELLHNRCDTSNVTYLVVPDWRATDCQSPGFTEISRHGHLILCMQEPKK